MRITAYADRLADDLDAWTGPRRSSSCSATGSAAARVPGCPSPWWARTRPSRSSPPARTRCSAPPSWCSRRSSTRCWRALSRKGIGRTSTKESWKGGAPPRRRPWRHTAPGVAQERGRAQPDRGQGQDRCVHRSLRHQPRQRRADPGLRRRLRADGLRHRRDHGCAGPGQPRLGGTPPGSSCPSCGRFSPPWATPRTRRTSARDGHQLGQPTRSPSTAWVSPRPRPPSSTGCRPRAWARGPSTTSCATGSSRASATGASRSRSSSTRRATATACPSRCCPSRFRTSGLLAAHVRAR